MLAAFGVTEAGFAVIANAAVWYVMSYIERSSDPLSVALIAYASAYLKCHHAAAFFAAMLNCYPMGFYHPATLVKDAQRHGVTILPIDVSRSDWLCTLEAPLPRLSLRSRTLGEVDSRHAGHDANRVRVPASATDPPTQLPSPSKLSSNLLPLSIYGEGAASRRGEVE